MFTGFILGFLGSFHCIGMCGPIALALPVSGSSAWARLQGALLYNGGKTLTYMLLGGIFGLVGQGIAFAGFQQGLSIGLGVLLLLFAFSYGRWNGGGKWAFWTGKLKQQLGALFGKTGPKTLLSIGMLNGLLPCGLVWMGIAGAVAQGNAFQGAVYMGLFGLGVAPALIGITFLGNFIGMKFRNGMRRALPYMVAAMGLLLVVRGMNLGIPYLSPQTATERGVHTIKMCGHHQ